MENSRCFVVSEVIITSQISCCKQDIRRGIQWNLQYGRHKLKKTNKQFLIQMFGWYVSPNKIKGSEGFQINQRLRMSLKWQRIYEWRSTNGDIKATPSRQVAVWSWKKYSIYQFGETDIPVRHANPGLKQIRPFCIHHVHLILNNSVGNFRF